VTVDLRPTSKTFKQWINVELSSDNYKLNYIPEGCAHGYQTLEDNCEVFYLMSQVYNLDYECGIKYSDPAFKITFPLEATMISEKDDSWESFKI
jgi:dTDP-4-dehydrorhamnose 3,5-epimerase